MGLLLSTMAFGAFIAVALVTYRLWRQQRRPERGLRRAVAAITFLIGMFLFHGMLRGLMPEPVHSPGRERLATTRGHDAMGKLGCSDCHSIGGGVVIGPDLRFAATKYDHDVLVRFIEDPQTIYAARHQHPLNQGFSDMPRLDVSAEDAEAIAAYLDSVAAHQ
jgi:mono/diheme cytochrome c family protein